MSFIQETIRAIRMTLVLWIITGILYPFAMVMFGQVVLPYQANGSLIKSQGKLVGSALIGQAFTSDRYFWSRPSATKYSTANPNDDKDNILKTGISGASNLAPSNKQALIDQRIKPRLERMRRTDINKIPADLVYASGSGLDPHISVEAAKAQAARIGQARDLFRPKINSLIDKYTEDRFLWTFGEPGVNVLKLNLELDNLSPGS